jgi:hypothetical protein
MKNTLRSILLLLSQISLHTMMFSCLHEVNPQALCVGRNIKSVKLYHDGYDFLVQEENKVRHAVANEFLGRSLKNMCSDTLDIYLKTGWKINICRTENDQFYLSEKPSTLCLASLGVGGAGLASFIILPNPIGFYAMGLGILGGSVETCKIQIVKCAPFLFTSQLKIVGRQSIPQQFDKN